MCVCVFLFFFTHRYNCNRYNEDDAKAARDAQEVNNVSPFVLVFEYANIVLNLKRCSNNGV